MYESVEMNDVLALVMTFGFFTLAWALVRGCERLLGTDSPLDDVTTDLPSDDASPVPA
jgi:hypothetical protein